VAEEVYFNQATVDKFREFQKLKRKRALDTIRTGAANVAEGVSATLGNRAAQKHRMPDESGTYMTRDQKNAASQPIIEGMEEREQFYFTSAVTQMQERAKLEQKKLRAVLEAAVDNRRIDQNAAEASARLDSTRLGKELTSLHRDGRLLLDSQADTIKAVKAVVAQAEASAEVWLDAEVETKWAEHVTAAGLQPEYMEASEIKGMKERIRSEHAGRAQQLAQAEALDQAANLMADMEPAQGAHAVDALMEAVGASPADLDPDHLDIYTTTSKAVLDQVKGLSDRVDATKREYTQAARRTYAGQAGTEAAIASMEASSPLSQFGGAGGQQVVAGGTTVSEAQQQQAAPPEQAQGMPQPQGPTTYFNDPSLPPVAGDANKRMEDILDLIEARPEHPPLQEAKSSLMQSADFRKFQSQRGYADPDVAFREMRRELRAKTKEQRRTSERRVSENIQSGKAPKPVGVAARVRKLARPSSTPVQGSVSRTPAEVGGDGEIS
jgi:hypothetical protein